MADKNPWAPADTGNGSENPWAPPPPERSPIKDIALSVGKGVVGMGEAAVGAADIATGGAAGNALQNLGYDPKFTRQVIDQQMSPAAQADAQAVQDQHDFLPTVAEVAKRPYYLANVVAESVPSMAGGLGIGRAAQVVAPKLTAEVAGAIGEGAVSAGQTAEQIRQDTGTLDEKGVLGAAGSGTLVGLTGAIGNVAARAAHVAAPDTIGLLNRGIDKVEGNVVGRMAKGAGIESAEEVVQSAFEQVGQNYAEGKPLGEDVGQQAAIGGMAGGVMGAGAGVQGRHVAAETDNRQNQNDPSVPKPAGPVQAAVIVGKASGAVQDGSQPTAPAQGSQTPSGMGGVRGLIAEAAARNGVDPATALTIAAIETGGRFNPDAKNPKSSAQGVFQFMDATRKAFPEVTPEMWQDPKVQAEYGAKFIAATNARMQQTLGRAPTPGEAYMGHLLGAYGATQLLTADPNAPVQDVVAQYDPKRAAEIVRLNGMKGLTAGEAVQKWDAIAQRAGERLGLEQNAFPFSTQDAAQMAVRSGAQEGRMLEVAEHPTVPGRFAALPPLAGDPNEAQPTSKVPLIADLPRHDESPNAAQAPEAVQSQPQGQASAGGLAVPGEQPVSAPADAAAAGAGAAPAQQVASQAAGGAADAQGAARTVVDPAEQEALRQELVASRGLVPGQDYNPNPTPGQAQAGNYKKVHESFEGLPVTLENPVGSTRRGVAADGTPWASTMTEADYGYVKRTRGADTNPFGGKPEQVDLYVAKERTPNAPVFVFDQHQLDSDGVSTGFDEHKAVAGAATLERAQQIYDSGFSDQSGPLRRAEATQMSMPEFKAWLKGGNTDSLPAAESAPQMRDAQAVGDGVLPPSIEAAPQAEPGLFNGVPEAAKYAADNGLDASPVQAEGGFALAPNVKPQTLTDEDTGRVAALNSALESGGFSGVQPLRDAPTPAAALAAHVAEKAFGVRVIHTEPSEQFSGVSYGDRVFLGANEQHPVIAVAGHEVTHAFEGTPVHRQLVKVFEELGISPSEQVMTRLAQEQANDGRPISKTYARNEVIADLNGSMWIDPKFWSEIATRDESLFRKVAYKFMEVATKAVQVVKGGRFDANTIVSDVDAARSAIAQAWADHLNAQRSAKKSGTSGEPLFARTMAPGVSPAARQANLDKFLEGSQVREPMYHGGARDITKFQPKQAGAVFVTPNPGVAQDFSEASSHYKVQHYLSELPAEKIAAAKEAATADIEEAWNRGDLNDEAIDMVEAIAGDRAEENGMAMDYLEPRLKEQMPVGENVMKLHVNAQNPFDYENPDHVRAVAKAVNAADAMAINDDIGGKGGDTSIPLATRLARGEWDVIEAKPVQAAIKALGHDGFYVREGGAKNLGVYSSSQLKSATGNVGIYNRENADIRFSKLAPIELPDKPAKNLTAPERAKMRRDVATRLVTLFNQLPSANEMAAVAWAGKAARGWYADSAMAIRHVFGPDANRFTALLAAMSPQNSVQNNLQNAAQVWAGWVKAGRPTERSQIVKVMGDNVIGNNRTESVLPAWINNSVRALTAADPERMTISGPKVNSFMQNLRGNVEEVTNDAWMAAFGAVNQKIFSGKLNAEGSDPGKGSGYLAMSARVREAAARLTQLSGEKWSPAEVQETVWSWAKTVYEMQEEREGGYGAREIIDNGELRDELIAATPEFSSLLLENKYASKLREAGYGQRIDDLRTLPSVGRGVASAGSQTPPFAEGAQRRYERAAADRLEKLRDARAQSEAETRKGLGADFALSKLSNQMVFEVAPDPRNEALKADWDGLSNNAKWTISRHVAREVLSAAEQAVGIEGRLRTQLGGYGPDSNPSIAVVFKENADPAKIDQLTRVMGSALSQQSMMRTSPEPFPGSFEMNAITVEYPKGFDDAKLHELYTAIRDVKDDKGEPYAGGHTTAEGSMVILDDGSRISGEELARKIADHLGEPFTVYNDTIHAAFPEAGDNEYGLAQQLQQGDHNGLHRQAVAGEAGSEAPLRQTADQLRDFAQRRLRQDIATGKANAAAAVQEVVRLSKSFGPALKDISVPEIKGRIRGKWTDLRSIALQGLGGRQIAEVYGRDLPQLPEYQKLVQLMQAGVNDYAARADKVASEWGRLKDERPLAELMHAATLAQIDPSKAFVEGDSASSYQELRAQWDKLSPEARKTYATARDMYEEHYAAVRESIRERIERAEGLSSQKKSEMLTRMDDKFFERVRGVYFPLARFGQYVVVARDQAGKVVSVSRAETKAEADTLRRELKGEFGAGYTVSAVIKAAEFNAKRDAVGSEFLSSLFKVLDETGIGEDLQDDINQLVLSSMPDLSWAKHGIHRKGTAGFSQDARRAFAQNMFHGARYLQRVRFGDRLEAKLAEAEKYVKGRNELTESVKEQQVLDEVRKRHEALMNPQAHPLAQALTSFGFLFHLGLSPASALVNFMQTPFIAGPILAGKYGVRAYKALTAAGVDTARAKNSLVNILKGDELAAVQKAIDEGTIDVTLAHDLAGIAQGNDSGIVWKARPVMRAASFMFHHAERFNRQATFLAAYRLARSAGASAEASFEAATDLTYASHFDYSASNRPRVMQGNAAKVVFQFKQYSQNMTYTLANSLRLALKGDREAMKTLGGLVVMNGLAAGALGVPLVAQILSLASMIGGSDDEPWDATVALQNYLADAFNQKIAEVMMRGVSRLGPSDISGRVSLDLYKMWLPDVNEALAGQDAYDSFLTGMAGPVIGGVGANTAKAVQMFGEGEWQRGLELMMPAVLRGPLRAARFAEEGAKTKDGIPIKEEVSPAGIASQALGFRPSEVANAQEGRGAIMALDKRLEKRRGELMDRFAKAAMSGDDTGTPLAGIQKWNETNPTRVIAGMHLQQAVATRTKRIQQSEQGVYLPLKKRDLLQEGRFAVQE